MKAGPVKAGPVKARPNQAGTGRASPDQAGTGLLASTWSVLAFFMFMFLAVQIGINLYSTSTVSALAFDASRRAASNGGTRTAIEEADRWLQDRLGSSLDVHKIAWRTDNGVVRLDVDVQPPSLLIGSTSDLGGRRITRSFEVRTELVRGRGS